MKLLVIDTATPNGMVVLGEDSDIVYSNTWCGPIKHAEVLADEVKKGLEVVGWMPGDLFGVGVALGPGSFMGLRIGLAFAKGIAAAVGARITGYQSLLALAKGYSNFDGVVIPIIDARRGEVYVAAYAPKKGFEKLLRPSVMPMSALVFWMKGCKTPFLLVGDGAYLYREQANIEGVEIVFDVVPKADVVLQMTFAGVKTGGDDLNSLVPFYVRLSDAEIGFRGRSLD